MVVIPTRFRSSSPVLQLIMATALPPTGDQRGHLRNGRSDIGAYEYQGNVLNLVGIGRTGTNLRDVTVSIEVVKGMLIGPYSFTNHLSTCRTKSGRDC